MRSVSRAHVLPYTRRGWQVTTTNIGLASYGLNGPSLPVWNPPNGEIVPNGTTISGMRINTTLDMHEGDILIEKCYIRPNNISPGFALIYNVSADPVPRNVTIRDCEITGEDATDAQVAYSSAFGGIANLERNYIHHTGSGIAILNAGTVDSVTIRNNHINQLRATGDAGGSGSHNDGITIRGFNCSTNPVRQCTVEGNYVNMDSGNDTGALFIQTFDDYIDNCTIRWNFFGGNGHQTGMEAQNAMTYGPNMSCIDNRMTNTDFGYGYITSNGLTYGWNTWANNYVYDGSAPDARGSALTAPLP